MKALAKKALVAAAGLAIVAAPLAASAQDWHHDGDRGAVYNRGHDRDDHRDWRDDRYRVTYGRPVYRAPYVDGYFGYSPAGWQGYYWHGNWYHHRRWNPGLGIYLYF